MKTTKKLVCKKKVDGRSLTSAINGRKGGRPLVYNDPEELQVAIDKFYEECKKTGRPFTLSGLAVELGVEKATITNYSKRDRFFETIRRAKLMGEMYSEQYLYSGKTPTGAIFALKNNNGWQDNRQVEISGSLAIDTVLTNEEVTHDKARMSAVEGEIVDDE